jgi:glyoxylase-like metal-dependent hydrolase (beta-lactamase superfamily II)
MTWLPTEQPIHFDDVAVTRVLEWAGPIKTVAEILPDTPAEDWQANRSMMAPDFWNPKTDAYLCHIQTWVIRVAGRTILVDTGVGNDRERPQIPKFAHMHTDFLDRLGAAGVTPEDVDIVINTHIHYDHVGWNTRLVDGAFVPTFPNATYLVPQLDYDYYHPDNVEHMRPPETEDEQQRFEGIRLVFADSIIPVQKAGQLQLWQDHYELPGLPISLEPAPGHTPGSSLARLHAETGALFVGDLLHSPMQVLHPDHRCSFDLDAAQARATRRRILNQAAVDESFILPAHLPGHSAFTVATDAEAKLGVERWADLPR